MKPITPPLQHLPPQDQGWPQRWGIRFIRIKPTGPWNNNHYAGTSISSSTTGFHRGAGYLNNNFMNYPTNNLMHQGKNLYLYDLDRSLGSLLNY